MKQILFVALTLCATLLTSLRAEVTSIWLVDQKGAAQTDAPVTFGHVFSPGDVPAGTTVEAAYNGGTALPTQVDAKARHADGSLRHAVITILAPQLLSGETKRILLESIADAGSSVPLTTDDLLKTDYDAAVNLSVDGELYTASVRNALQSKAEEPQEWLSGELVTEWLIRAPIKTASGAEHPHLTARFFVRAYKGLKQIRTAVIIENNWTFVPEPSGFQYDISVSIGDRQVYSKSGLEHTHHTRWRKVFWWGEDPDIHVKHNLDYLTRTKSIPNYDREVSISPSATSGMRTEFEPMDHMDISQYMPTTGAQDGIGPLPRWTTLYLLTMEPVAKKNTLVNADAAASYYVHYRDEKTDLPVTLDDYPYMTLLGKEGDTYNPNTGQYESFPEIRDPTSRYYPDDAHQPSLTYVPYLVTGDYYFLEELQFWANWNMIIANPYYRDLEKGLLRWAEVRGQAWSLRTLGHAAYITPDDHPLKSYFVKRVQNNIDYYRANLVDDPETNALGYLDMSAIIYGNYGVAPWQDDFFTWAVGHLVELGFLQAQPLFEWKAKFVLGRMGTEEFCWLHATSYSLQVGDSDRIPYTTFREMQLGNFGDSACTGTVMDGSPESDTGYGANMQPALALVTEADLAGATIAWSRYESRYPKQDYSLSPQFAVVPREASSGTPLSPPDISPMGGTFEESVTVTLSSANDAQIYYTLDGSTPGEQSILYDEPFTITESLTIAAVCCMQGIEPSEISHARFEITPDLVPPTILSVSAYLNPAKVEVLFSEPVSQTAEVTSNYVIDKGAAVSSASLDSSGQRVVLQTSELVEQTEYTLTVSNITDLARDPNTIADNTTVLFYAGQLGVELSSFTAKWKKRAVEITWITESESMALGFHVLKSLEREKNFQRINEKLIKAAGTSTESRKYIFEDKNLNAGETYYYILQQLDFNGARTRFGPIAITTPDERELLPKELTLYNNYPNPFNAKTTIICSLPQPGFTTVQIYTIGGQHVASLMSRKLNAGVHKFSWDATQVPSGVYLVRVDVVYDSHAQSDMVFQKMILVK